MKTVVAILWCFVGPAGAVGQSSPAAILKKEAVEWSQWFSTAKDSVPYSLWDRLFNWEETVRRGMRNWVNLSASWKDRMMTALRRRIATDGTAFLKDIVSAKSHDLQWQNETIADDEGRVVCDLMLAREKIPISFRLLRLNQEWKVYDVRSPDFRLRNFIREYDQLVTEGFALEYVESLINEDSVISIDAFDTQPAGVPQKGWGWRKHDADFMTTQPAYFIRQNTTGGELAAVGRSFPFVKPFSYHIREFPILSWRWSMDGEASHGPDIVAKMTIIFYQNWIGVPVTISYLWTRNWPTCTTIQNKGWLYDDHEIVLRRGVDGSQWQEENVDVVKDYTRIFGEPPPGQCTGISVIVFEPYRFRFDNFQAKRSTAALSCGQ